MCGSTDTGQIVRINGLHHIASVLKFEGAIAVISHMAYHVQRSHMDIYIHIYIYMGVCGLLVCLSIALSSVCSIHGSACGAAGVGKRTFRIYKYATI